MTFLPSNLIIDTSLFSSEEDQLDAKMQRIRPKPPFQGRSAQCNLYSDWVRSQDRNEIYHLCTRLYTLLNLSEENPLHARQRAMWSRRLRTRCTEDVKTDLYSTDPICNQRALKTLKYHKQTKHGAFDLGERRILSMKLNKYWKMEDEMKAYQRFTKQAVKYPAAVEMARSNDEEVVKQAAWVLTPREYCRFNRSIDNVEEREDPSDLHDMSRPQK